MHTLLELVSNAKWTEYGSLNFFLVLLTLMSRFASH